MAILTPAVAAQADVAAPSPLAPVTHSLDGQFRQDTNLWWFGAANPNLPAPFMVLGFPGVLRRRQCQDRPVRFRRGVDEQRLLEAVRAQIFQSGPNWARLHRPLRTRSGAS